MFSYGEPDGFVRNEDIYRRYKTWCTDNGVTPKGQTQLTQALKAKGYRAGELKKIMSVNYRGVYGLKEKELQMVTGNT